MGCQSAVLAEFRSERGHLRFLVVFDGLTKEQPPSDGRDERRRQSNRTMY